MSANLPILWADKKNSPLLADFIAKYGSQYCMTAEEINQLRDAVNEMAVIQQSTFLGAAEPAFTPAGTGRAYWIAVKPGTYANHGSVVVAANEIAFIIRDAAGAFSISKTGLDLTATGSVEIGNNVAISGNTVYNSIKTMRGSEMTFLTKKEDINKCFQFSTTGNGSLTVPSGTVYYLDGETIDIISNAGAVLAIPDGNAQVIYIDTTTRAISIGRYDSLLFNTNKKYKIVGKLFVANKRIDIRADVYIDGLIDSELNNISKTNIQKYVFDPLMANMVIDTNGVAKYAIVGNGATTSVVNNSLQITASNSGYVGILFYDPFFLQVGKEYYGYLEVRKISGEDAVWVMGDPRYQGQNFAFTPTAEWKVVQGKFITTAQSDYGMFICAQSTAIVNEVIQIRNVFVKQRTGVEQDHESRIILLEGGVPPDFDLQNELNTKENVFVPVGTHILNAPLVIPSGRKIYGVRGKSIIKAGATLAKLIDINGVTDVSLTDLTIKGTGTNTTLGGAHNGPLGGVVDSFLDAINEVNKGTKTGIYLNESERVNISGCDISGFDAYGIHDLLCGKTFEHGIKISDNYVHDNYCNLKIENEAEYSSYVGNSFTLAQIGLRCDSGNNLFASNHIDKNRVGLVMTGGYNNSHGTFSACTFNHNTLYGLCLDSLSAGEVFSACQHWYGDIYIRNSKGIVFNGGEGNPNFYIDGKFATGGMTLVTNFIFFGGTMYQNYNGNISDLRLKNNYKADGTDSSYYNN